MGGWRSSGWRMRPIRTRRCRRARGRGAVTRQIKREGMTPPIPVGQSVHINWPADQANFFRTPDDKGKWQVDVVVDVKDASNPEPTPLQGNNRASTTFEVLNNPATATL